MPAAFESANHSTVDAVFAPISRTFSRDSFSSDLFRRIINEPPALDIVGLFSDLTRHKMSVFRQF